MDYKKKYKEAQKWIESIYPELSHEQQMEAEAFFPELQESEDEKIREMLIRIYKKADMGGEIFGEGITYKQVIAWLEKQGEHKRFRDSIQIGDSVTKNEYDELVNLSQLNRVAKRDADILKKQSEQKSTTIDVDKMVSDYASHNEKRNEIFGKPVPCMVRAYKQGICDTLESLGEGKPFEKEFTFKAIPRLLDMIEPSDRAKAYCQKLIDTLAKEGYNTDAKIVEGVLKGWNGEDVPMAVMDEKQGEQKPDSFCREHCKGFQETGKCFADGDCKTKREAEQKPAWGEDDEKRLQSCINILKAKSLMGKVDTANTMWLKSLKQRIGG